MVGATGFEPATPCAQGIPKSRDEKSKKPKNIEEPNTYPGGRQRVFHTVAILLTTRKAPAIF